MEIEDYAKKLNKVDIQTGVLNIAPIKISGQYKIVIALDGKLYLDDYCGRRVPIDLNTPFLHQVSNFLSVGSILVDSNNIKYGGYENSGIKTYHIPLYFGDYNNKKLPRFFCVAHVPNETINTQNNELNNLSIINIYRYGDLLRVVDFEKIGITKIFEEIISEHYFDYPVYFNFEDNNIKIFGQGINEGYPVVKTIDITNNMANQTYLDVLDNRILNAFIENKTFFPRFLNIELEFEFSSEHIPYHNFHGLISYGDNEIQETGIYDKQLLYGYVINLLDNKSNWKQIKVGDEIKNSEPIPDRSYDFLINEVEEQPYKYRFKTSSCLPYDEIKIIKNYGIEEIYQIETDDVRSEDLFTNWYVLCKKFTNQSNRELIFKIKKIDKFTVEISITTDIDDYVNIFINTPEYYIDLDLIDSPNINNNIFINRFKIQKNACVHLVSGNQYSDNTLVNIFDYGKIKNIRIDNCLIPDFKDAVSYIYLTKYDGFKNLMFLSQSGDFFDSKIINKQSVLHFDVCTKDNKPLLLCSIPYLTTYDTCESDKLYNFDNYKKALKTSFNGRPVFEKAFNQFNEQLKTNYEYVDYQNNEDKKQLNQDLTNEVNVVDIKFKSVGQTAYNTVNLLNVDEQCWSQNGCPDIQKNTQDDLRFAWFSVLNHYASNSENYRFCNIEPFGISCNTISRLIRVSDSTCETIYFGIKYQLPIQYENYYFAVVLNWNDKNYNDLTCNIRINDNLKQVTLVLNKYIDFSDLIRGGNQKEQNPLFNIGLLYNITNSSNSSSDNISAFKTCGLLLEPFYNGQVVGSDSKIDNLPLFEGEVQKDWIITKNNKQYFCVRRDFVASVEATNDLRLLFELGDYPNTPTNECYVYSKCEILNNETGKKETKQYKAITIKFRNIVALESDYLWCENIEVYFFDAEKIYIQNVNDELGVEIDYINRVDKYVFLNIFDFQKNKWNSHYIDKLPNGKPLVEIYSKKFDFKKYYFEITQILKDNEFGKQQPIELSRFVFKNGYFVRKTPEELNVIFKGSEHPDSFIISESGLNGKFEREEANIYYSKRTLFDYNQLWLLIQNMLRFNLLFKYQTSAQLQLFTDDFTVTKLMEVTKVPLPIIYDNNNKKQSTKYLKVDVVDISRNNVIWDISKVIGNVEKRIVEINRHSGPYFPHFAETNIENFQLNKYKKFGTIMNIYDKNYGNLILNEIENIEYPYDISATCLWNEFHGNIISSLFCFNREFILEYIIHDLTDTVNYHDLLTNYFIYEDLIITSTNNDYLESLNKNVRDFTIESFVDNLLSKYYKLESISNELGERIYFWKTKDVNVIQFKNPNIYGSDVLRYSKLKLKFTRK